MRPIDADKLDEAITNEHNHDMSDTTIMIGYRQGLRAARAIVISQPTIDSEEPQPRGEWTYYSSTMMECSNCKRHVPRHRYEFCPRCGTPMDFKA